ncbi:MAG TPA: hypothetical protein VLA43_06235 [Longimicrobiales bacterium]|nr:hypothetical protein [Longimicrobiales bacterium]
MAPPVAIRRLRHRAFPLLALSALACAEGLTLPGEEPSATGIVAGVNGADYRQFALWAEPDSVTSVLVLQDGQDPCGTVYRVDSATVALVRQGSALRRAVPGDFTAWRSIRVWARETAPSRSAVVATCPGYADAEALELR